MGVNMKNISVIPEFNSDNDRLITIGTIILSICLSFIPPLITVLFAKSSISESSYRIAKALFNFELLLFLISLISVIPIIGWIVGIILIPILVIYNAIILLVALLAIAKQQEVKIPVMYEFL